MGCDIHMAVQVQQPAGYLRADSAIRAYQRLATAGDAEAARRLEALTAYGPWELVACEHYSFLRTPLAPGWRTMKTTPNARGWQEDVATRLEVLPEPWFESRDYETFARLAGVRNSGEVTPIVEPRGLPEGFALPYGLAGLVAKLRERRRGKRGWEPDRFPELVRRWARAHPDYQGEAYALEQEALRLVGRASDGDDYVLGDHSHTWLLASEVLAYEGWGTVQRSGAVEHGAWRAWRESGADNPTGWAAWVGGGFALTVDESEAEGPAARAHRNAGGRLYVNCAWESPREWPMVEMAKAWAARFGAERVRFCFGFDS